MYVWGLKPHCNSAKREDYYAYSFNYFFFPRTFEITLKEVNYINNPRSQKIYPNNDIEYIYSDKCFHILFRFYFSLFLKVRFIPIETKKKVIKFNDLIFDKTLLLVKHPPVHQVVLSFYQF